MGLPYPFIILFVISVMHFVRKQIRWREEMDWDKKTLSPSHTQNRSDGYTNKPYFNLISISI